MQWDELYPKLHSSLDEPSWLSWLVLHEHTVHLFPGFIDFLYLGFLCISTDISCSQGIVALCLYLVALGLSASPETLPRKILVAQNEICVSYSDLCFLIIHSSLHNTVWFYWLCQTRKSEVDCTLFCPDTFKESLSQQDCLDDQKEITFMQILSLKHYQI